MGNIVNLSLIESAIVTSKALEISNANLSGHQLRTAYISIRMGLKAKLSDKDFSDLVVAALLHDIGALAPEEKYELFNSSSSNFFVSSNDIHCINGEKVLKKSKLLETPSKIVRLHHTDYSKIDNVNNRINYLSQIVFLADLVDRIIDHKKYILFQNDYIIRTINSLKGLKIAPEIVELFESVSHTEEFWLDISSPNLEKIVKELCSHITYSIPTSEFYTLSEILRNIIDFRSSYTASHSKGLASVCNSIGKIINYNAKKIELLEIASNLHDLGKIAIPNRILEKPSKLTNEECAVMRQHSYHTYSILKNYNLITLSKWAGYHHEKLDGSGYPHKINGDNLCEESRMIAVADIFTALAETRPYREGMSLKQIRIILKKMVSEGKIDSSIVKIVLDNMSEILIKMKYDKGEIDEEYYNNFQSKEATPYY